MKSISFSKYFHFKKFFRLKLGIIQPFQPLLDPLGCPKRPLSGKKVGAGYFLKEDRHYYYILS